MPGGLAVPLGSGRVLGGGTSSTSTRAEARAEVRCRDLRVNVGYWWES
jgi:hypothetical protein